MKAELSIIPLKGNEGISERLSRIRAILKEAGVHYSLSPAGAQIDSDAKSIIELIDRLYAPESPAGKPKNDSPDTLARKA